MLVGLHSAKPDDVYTVRIHTDVSRAMIRCRLVLACLPFGAASGATLLAVCC